MQVNIWQVTKVFSTMRKTSEYMTICKKMLQAYLLMLVFVLNCVSSNKYIVSVQLCESLHFCFIHQQNVIIALINTKEFMYVSKLSISF